MLGQAYALSPGWERLDHPARLGWAALACALDASLDLGLLHRHARW